MRHGWRQPTIDRGLWGDVLLAAVGCSVIAGVIVVGGWIFSVFRG